MRQDSSEFEGPGFKPRDKPPKCYLAMSFGALPKSQPWSLLNCEALLQRWRTRWRPPQERAPFCQADGKPLHAHNVTQRDLRDVRKRAKLPRVRFHDLRHTSGTLLLKQGTNLKVVQERLGHSTPAFTLKVYSHVLPGMQEQAARELEERLFSGSTQDREG